MKKKCSMFIIMMIAIARNKGSLKNTTIAAYEKEGSKDDQKQDTKNTRKSRSAETPLIYVNPLKHLL